MYRVLGLLAALTLALFAMRPAVAQQFGRADDESPGDAMIQRWLAIEAQKLNAHFAADLQSRQQWEDLRATYRQEYLEMLGLWPEPPRGDLQATVTGSVAGDGYVVDLLHFQSSPRLYVTANLYRPAESKPGHRYPAVVYVCGHSSRGRDGNKTAYQSHGMWFARHGYLCLVLDTLQLGEIAAVHHGTYREQRWWWHSRGYTPAGVECWNGIRGIDYLVQRPDVDPARIAVTGISGGGAATFWIAAADERVSVAVPVSGMADLPSYVGNRVVNGHCDCMFLHNCHLWPWTRIAALITPRPLLFVNSDQDAIFPMDANERVINRLERHYSMYGAGDQVEAVVSIGGHAYREDIRRAVYGFVRRHLQGDAAKVTDSEVDLVTGPREDREHPIAPEKLRVFPADDDVPLDQLNTEIDQHFVPTAQVQLPPAADYAEWRERLLRELRRLSFRWLPDRVAAARPLDIEHSTAGMWLLETEPAIELPVQRPSLRGAPARVVLVVDRDDAGDLPQRWQPEDAVIHFQPRGIGPTRWTQKNPPNYVERAHVLVGRTVDAARIFDVLAMLQFVRREYGEAVPIVLAGRSGGAVIAAYAAVLDGHVAELYCETPAETHMQADAPQVLNALRVWDVPQVVGMAPGELQLIGASQEFQQQVEQLRKLAQAAR